MLLQTHLTSGSVSPKAARPAEGAVGFCDSGQEACPLGTEWFLGPRPRRQSQARVKQGCQGPGHTLSHSQPDGRRATAGPEVGAQGASSAPARPLGAELALLERRGQWGPPPRAPAVPPRPGLVAVSAPGRMDLGLALGVHRVLLRPGWSPSLARLPACASWSPASSPGVGSVSRVCPATN